MMRAIEEIAWSLDRALREYKVSVSMYRQYLDEDTQKQVDRDIEVVEELLRAITNGKKL